MVRICLLTLSCLPQMKAFSRRDYLERREKDQRHKQLMKEDIERRVKLESILRSKTMSEQRVQNIQKMRTLQLRDEELRIEQALLEVNKLIEITQVLKSWIPEFSKKKKPRKRKNSKSQRSGHSKKSRNVTIKS
jgi:hypothetical protein